MSELKPWAFGASDAFDMAIEALHIREKCKRFCRCCKHIDDERFCFECDGSGWEVAE